MSEQQKFEVIKAFAYGRTAEEIALAEEIDISEVEKVQRECASDIAEEIEDLRKAGYLE